jgi:hypothetical protein
MKGFLSIVRYVSDPVSNENIAVGVLMVSNEGKVYFKTSKNKLNLVKKINPKSYKLVLFTLNQLALKLGVDDKYSQSIFKNNSGLRGLDFLENLHSYNNGLIQFSKPIQLEDEVLNYDSLMALFKKYVEKDYSELAYADEKTTSGYQVRLNEKLHEPLRERIDVQFKLQKEQIRTLYFDYEIDAIGVNGRIYAAKSIDINHYQKVGELQRQIAEFESLINRLKIFAEQRNLKPDHNINLIVEPYKGDKSSIRELYNIISIEKMPLFQVIETDKTDSFVASIIKNKATPFSELLS